MIASNNQNLEIEVVINQPYSTFTATQIVYEATSGDGCVYEKVGEAYNDLLTTSASRSSTWTLETFLGIKGKTLASSDESNENIQILALDGLQVEFNNGTRHYYSVGAFGLTNDMTMYDFIEIILNDSRNSTISFGNGEVFEISSLTAVFAPTI